MTEWRRRNPKRSTTEMGQENQRSCSRALQRQASFIANRGWKSSNSSPLSVGGELFPLTSPFIEQAIALKTPAGTILSAIEISRQLSLAYRGMHTHKRRSASIKSPHSPHSRRTPSSLGAPTA